MSRQPIVQPTTESRENQGEGLRSLSDGEALDVTPALPKQARSAAMPPVTLSEQQAPAYLAVLAPLALLALLVWWMIN